MTTWSIEDQANGSVVVSWNRQRQTFGSYDEAVKFVRERRSKTDRVVRVHTDGYKTPVTRKRWRRRGTDL